MNDLTNYIQSTFGVQASIQPLHKSEQKGLPLYLANNYNLYKGALQQSPVIWAFPAKDIRPTPAALIKQSQQLQHFLHAPVIFVFNHLESWLRNRLTQKQVAFVQVNRQLFVPWQLIHLSDLPQRNEISEATRQSLAPPAQLAVLYHLQKASLENQSFQQLAQTLGYSTMTVTRIIKELNACKLVEVNGSKIKTVSFRFHGIDLWKRAAPLMNSPVKEEWFAEKPIPSNLKYMAKAGDSALEAYTMLTSGKETYAISKDHFRTMKNDAALQLNKNDGECKIQSWHYNPLLLTNDHTVDKLSLFLSIENKDDERVSASLDELIKSVKW